MSAPNPTCSDDLRLLEILHSYETDGAAKTLERFRISNGALQGIKGRTLRIGVDCACTRAANKDGGVPPRWWAE